MGDIDDPVSYSYRRDAINTMVLAGYTEEYAKKKTSIHFWDDFVWSQIPQTKLRKFHKIYNLLEPYERGSLAEDAYLHSHPQLYGSIHNAAVDFGVNRGFGMFGFNSKPYGEIKFSEANPVTQKRSGRSYKGTYPVSNYQIHAAGGNLILIRPSHDATCLEFASVKLDLPAPA